MVAAFLGDKAARQLDDVAPHDRRHQRSGVKRLREKGQTAERMIDAREIFFQMAADLRSTTPGSASTSTKRNNATRRDSSSSDQSIIRPSKSLASKSDGLCSAAF